MLHWFCWQSNEPEDRLYAALAVLSLLAIYVIAYFSHHDLTHTTIMTAFIVLGWWQFTRLVSSPGWFNYIVLGIVFAGGLLGKWNYVVFCVALAFTCLLLAGYRHLVWTPKIFATMAATSLLVLPTLWFVASMERPYTAIAEAALAEASGSGMTAILVEGTGALIASLLVYLLPFLLFAGAFFLGPVKNALSFPGQFLAEDTDCRGAVTVTPGFLLVFSLVGTGLLWLLVPVLGAVKFTERWMQPVVFTFPFLVMMLVRIGKPSFHTIRKYLMTLAGFTVLVIVARVGMQYFSADYCGSCRALVPFPELARQIKAGGFDKGTIIADRFHIGGNLRVAFPDSRIIDPHYPLDVWPRQGRDGQCLWVWETARSAKPPGHFWSFVDGELAAELLEPDHQGVATALLHGSGRRTYSLSWWLFEQHQGDCN